jgi:hypothetical protein
MTDTSNTGTNVVALHDDNLDRRVLKARLNGTSVNQLSKKFRVSTKVILSSLDRALPAIDATTRARIFREDLARLDELLMPWYKAAKEGNATACALTLKILERRAHLTGIDAPEHMRVELLEQRGAEMTSTERLLFELDRIANERVNRLPEIIEGEVTPAEPSPDFDPSPSAA